MRNLLITVLLTILLIIALLGWNRSQRSLKNYRDYADARIESLESNADKLQTRIDFERQLYIVKAQGEEIKFKHLKHSTDSIISSLNLSLKEEKVKRAETSTIIEFDQSDIIIPNLTDTVYVKKDSCEFDILFKDKYITANAHVSNDSISMDYTYDPGYINVTSFKKGCLWWKKRYVRLDFENPNTKIGRLEYLINK